MRWGLPLAGLTKRTILRVRGANVTAVDLSALGLPQIFSPAGAAEILRDLGLAEMTECALRTRAYRKQVPFHLNGRRIIFTLGDLREIAEGEACRPHPRDVTVPPRAASQPRPRRRSTHRGSEAKSDLWRARGPYGLQVSADNGSRT